MSWFPIPQNIPHAAVISSDKLKALEAEAAATPELLKALKDIAAYYPNSWAADTANAAIAKATGITVQHLPSDDTEGGEA